MALDFVGNATEIVVSGELLAKASTLITLFQAIGGLIIAYLIFNIISLLRGRKRGQDMRKIRELLESIDKKLGKKKR